ncbi:MerR family transcriptional regulator [Paenibacillus marchantiophytorum]|uniref:MerR family transcriptional regulator n=1 Tax=Paenibacillus marchantiophytorum TaxID=1619310 RepID=A0ABQ2BTT2_9BACL|nr:MerR family transcriptional regulator [Paenibacillus marchantiophytorum]GGI46595.1 MerR family transcriptional regulator [Paenibacillus marchantiophytorum]
MYTISRFSKLCKMSTRMLRHYDKEQLLKPIHVDATNGYRYYDKDQLEMALQIKKLREYKFSLPEIREIFQTADEKSLNEWMLLKIQELSNEINSHREIIADMQGIIDQEADMIHREGRIYDVLFGKRSEIPILSQRLRINIADMDHYIDSLYIEAKDNHIQLLGAPSAIFWDEEFTSEECDIELMIPISQGHELDAGSQWQIQRLPDKLIATTLHMGSYDYIGYAHTAIEEWIACNDYVLDGPPYETYLKSLECDCSLEEYVTQVCFPIMKK